MSKSKSILDFFKVNLESEIVTHDSPEDHDHISVWSSTASNWRRCFGVPGSG